MTSCQQSSHRPYFQYLTPTQHGAQRTGSQFINMSGLKFNHLDTRRKTNRWTFMLTSYNDDDLKQIQNLSREDFKYITYAKCTDDTGNKFIQGLLYCARRFYESKMRRLLDSKVMFTIPESTFELYETIATIHLTNNTFESGNASKSSIEAIIEAVRHFKTDTCNGIPSNDLAKRHPHIFLSFPRLFS